MIRRRWIRKGIFAFAVCSLTTCIAAFAESVSQSLKERYHRPAEIPISANNLYTPEKAALGKALYVTRDCPVSGNTRQFVTMLSDLAQQAALLRKQSSEFVGRILAA
jgi:hypothetical protein